MIVVTPVEITDARLISSTAQDVAPTLWASGTTYAAGAFSQIAIANNGFSVYESLQAGNINHAPASSPTWWKWINDAYYAYDVAKSYAKGDRAQDNVAHLVYESQVASNVGNPLTDTTKWLKVGATVKWAPFDNKIGTATLTSSPLTIVLAPEGVDSLGLLEMVGRNLVVVGTDGPGGAEVYRREQALDGTPIESFFDWFYSDYEQLSDLILLDLPRQFENLRLSVTITSTVGNVSVGVAKPGLANYIGETEKGASVGIIDFSRKERDATFGTIEVLERGYSKRGSFPILTDAFSFNRIYRALARNRAVPCFYAGADSELGFEPLLIYGFFRDFSIAIDYDIKHMCTLEVEGITND